LVLGGEPTQDQDRVLSGTAGFGVPPDGEQRTRAVVERRSEVGLEARRVGGCEREE